MTLKVDIDATLSAIRKASDRSGALPGQDAAELACNRDGVEVVIAFARWRFQQADLLSAEDLAAATGMLVGQIIVGALGAFDDGLEATASAMIIGTAVDQVDRYLSGRRFAGDDVVHAITRDVGDA